MKTNRMIILILSFVLCAITPILSMAQQANLTPGITSAEWSRDGSRFAIVTREGISIFDHNLKFLVSEEFDYFLGFGIPDIALSPDGSKIYVANDSERQILDTDTLEPILDLQDADILYYTPQWSNDSNQMAFRRGDARATVIYDISTGSVLHTFTSDVSPYWSAGYDGYPIWSPDNNYFAGVVGGKFIVIFDAETGQQLYQYEFPDKLINSIAWSPDSSRLALSTQEFVDVGSPDSFLRDGQEGAIRNSLEVIDIMNGDTLFSQAGLRNLQGGLAWNPNGTELASSGGYRQLDIWDTEQGILIDSYLTAPYAGRLMQYSPYGGQLVRAYNLFFEVSERSDYSFVPLSTYTEIALDGEIQFIAPASSPDKLSSILSLCVTDQDSLDAGNQFIESRSYSKFIQWVNQQQEQILPSLCGQDLTLIAETLLSKMVVLSIQSATQPTLPQHSHGRR